MTQTQTPELKAADVRLPEKGRVPAFLKTLREQAVQNAQYADPSALHVKIQIGKKGELDQKVFNGDGKNCLALTEQMEQARGGVTSRELEAGCDDDENRRTRLITNDRQRL